MADCSKEGVEGMIVRDGSGPIKFDGTNAPKDSRRIAAHAEAHLPSVTVVSHHDGEIERRLDDGRVETRSVVVLVVKIGAGDREEWYEVVYPVPDSKSERLTPDDISLSQLDAILAVPGRRNEMLALIRKVGTRLN